MCCGNCSDNRIDSVVGFADPKEKEESDTEKGSTNEEICGEEIVDSPMRGEVIPLSEVHDEVFSGEMMGKGCAIVPEEGKYMHHSTEK